MEDLKELSSILKVLSNKHRLRILQFLKNPQKYLDADSVVAGKKVCVGHIEKMSDLSQSTVSHYLTQLHKVDLVTLERKGQLTLYAYNGDRIRELSKLLESL